MCLDSLLPNVPKSGRIVRLPGTVSCFPHFYLEQFHKAVMLDDRLGPPHMFITATANPNWQELEVPLDGANWEDRPELVVPSKCGCGSPKMMEGLCYFFRGRLWSKCIWHCNSYMHSCFAVTAQKSMVEILFISLFISALFRSALHFPSMVLLSFFG